MGWLFIQSRFTCSHIYTATLQSKYLLQGNISTGYILLVLLESIIGTNLHFVSTYCDLNTRYYPNYCSGQLKFIFEWKKWPSFIEQTTARADKGDLKTFSTGADEISIFTFLRGAKPTVIHFSLLFGNKISFTKIERCSSARGSVVHGWWQNCRLPARAVNGTSKNFTMLRGPSFCWRHYAQCLFKYGEILKGSLLSKNLTVFKCLVSWVF